MHKIAWLPGDGIGRDVMAIARLVLDALGFKAKYIHGDVGWEFWKKEANPLPDRTIKILRSTDCCIFGAITSKPQPEALRELEIKVKNPVLQEPNSKGPPAARFVCKCQAVPRFSRKSIKLQG